MFHVFQKTDFSPFMARNSKKRRTLRKWIPDGRRGVLRPSRQSATIGVGGLAQTKSPGKGRVRPHTFVRFVDSFIKAAPMTLNANTHGPRAFRYASIFKPTRIGFVVAAFFALFAALSDLVEQGQTNRARTSVSMAPPVSSEGSRSDIPQFSAIVGDSGASLSESFRIRTRSAGRSRLSRLARFSQGGPSSERQSPLCFSSGLFQDRFHVSSRVFSRLLREKTSPRPLWLFFLVLLN
jgi:hypothetical protein